MWVAFLNYKDNLSQVHNLTKNLFAPQALIPLFIDGVVKILFENVDLLRPNVRDAFTILLCTNRPSRPLTDLAPLAGYKTSWTDRIEAKIQKVRFLPICILQRRPHHGTDFFMRIEILLRTPRDIYRSVEFIISDRK